MAGNQLSIPWEEWKAIPGFPGYEASTHGRIRSYWKQVIKIKGKRGRKYILSDLPQRILKPGLLPSGHLIVRLAKEEKIHSLHIHRLILLTFVGPCPLGMVCCHNNGIANDNHVANLRWDTPESNYRDRDKHGRTLVGIKNHKAKINEKQVKEIRKLAADGYNNCQIGKMYDLDNSTISDIVRRVGWKHVV